MAQFHIPQLAADLERTLRRLDQEEVVRRIWDRDHTVWSPSPEEIGNRLGWLDLAGDDGGEDTEVTRFVEEVREAGLRHAVLLGMGGSSLGAEALRASFGPREGFLELHVLDSTHPDWVRRVRREIDPAHTLFLVASKSGTTAEVLAFFKFFWGETTAAVGEDAAGRHFCAVTDPGTPLVDLAASHGFRHTFLNPPDIGGRFSVLSRFGTVAAALAGIDTAPLLERAREMTRRCREESAAENPGAWLGALLGTAVAAGRDHLTLLTSPQIECFGLWAEQLIAESTGKNGTGVLPITAEPLAEPARYGDRRLFVALRLRGDSAADLDHHLARLRDAGQPVVEIELENTHDLGAEFFRWEMATAVAGHLLGIHPFDQPDVQSTKSETRRLLDAYDTTGELPEVEANAHLIAALQSRPAPTFVAFMLYGDQNRGLEVAIRDLRHHFLDDLGLATTFGYGPRFLHSTGQLHKGGADGGLFVQLLARPSAELHIHGETYGLGLLLEAQAAGDLAALQGRNRRCVRIDLGEDPAGTIRRMIDREEGISPTSDLPFF